MNAAEAASFADRLHATPTADGWQAGCPACQAAGHDKKGNHLHIYSDGRFGCCQFPGDRDHRKQIFALAGDKPKRNSTPTRKSPTAKSPAAKEDKLPKLWGNYEAAIKAALWSLNKTGSHYEPVKKWLYQDSAGLEVAYVIRFEDPKEGGGGKEYKPMRAEPGGWRNCDPDTAWPIYHLPEVIKSTGTVFVTEGEKCCDSARSVGLPATTSSHGAKSPHLTDWTPLAGREVVILPDCDPDGETYASKVAGIVTRLNPPATVRIVRLSGLPAKGDFVEFLEARDSSTPKQIKDEVLALVSAAPEWTPPLEVLPACRLEVDSDTDPDKRSELYYADRLAASLPPIKTTGSEWFSYEVGAWQKTSRDIFRPKAQAVLPESIRSAHRETALLNHLEGRLQVSSDSFTGFYKFTPDGDVLLNVSNGVLRLTPDGETRLEAHDQAHAFTTKTAASYDPKATAPLFNRILGEALPDEQDRVLFQLCAGNFLYPDCRFEVAVVCHGEAGTGKSTAADPIAMALGKTLVPRLTMSQICDPKSYHVPRLRWAAVNLGTELDAIEMDDSGAFKALVTGEPIEARPIYAPPFTMQTTCKLWFLANSLPRFKHGSEAELRRTRFLRFDRLPPAKDVTLKARLATERDGVFLWMVAGLVELLNLPSIPLGGNESRQVHDRFKISNDPVGSFVKARCRLDTDSRASKQSMANAYEEFCVSHALPLSWGNWFFKALYERWPQLSEVRVGSDGTRERCIDGIALNS